MNRRGFLLSMLKAAVACAVLPGAVTCARTWKPLASGVVVPMDGVTIASYRLILGATSRQLFAEQQSPQIYILSEEITRLIKSRPDIFTAPIKNTWNQIAL